MTSRSRRMLFSRGVHFFPPSEIEGAGNAGRPMRPRSRVQDVIESAHEHTGHTGIARHSPRNGFNGVYRALPGAPGFLATVARVPSRRLDTSVGVSGPHVFAVRVRC